MWLKIVVTVVGAVLIFWAFQEFRVSRGTSSVPEDVALADLENDPATSNNYVTVGKHLALLTECVYEYKERRRDRGGPQPSTPVTYCYYPIISYENPFFGESQTGAEERGGIKNLPQDALDRPIRNVAVVVKTKRFNKVGDIPVEMRHEESITGLFVNRIESLNNEERRLLTEGLLRVDLNKALILEEGRQPASLLKSFGIFAVGVLFLGGGIVWLLENRLPRSWSETY